MKKIVSTLLIVLLILAIFTSILFAEEIKSTFQNEPDGFRGLKWGDAPAEDMVFVGTISCEGSSYYRKDDKLNIGSADLDYIFYIFNLYSNQFYKVRLIFTGKYNYDILKIIFEGRFGEPIWKAEDGYSLQWMGEIEPHKARIYLHFYPEKQRGSLQIVSEEIHRETPEYDKQKEVEKAKEDF